MDLRPLETINFFYWWTHFGLFKVHLQIALKALQSFFIKELRSFCQFCELPIPLSAYFNMLHLFTLPTTLTTGLIPQTRKTKSVSGFPDKSVHLRPSDPKHLVRVQIPFWSRKRVHKYKAPQTQSELLYLNSNNLHWIRHTKDLLCPKFPLFTFRQKSFFNESGPM